LDGARLRGRRRLSRRRGGKSRFDGDSVIIIIIQLISSIEQQQ
jgi:hypothetical protein